MTHINNVQGLNVSEIKSKVTEGFASLFISNEKQNEIINSIYEADKKMHKANDNINSANDELVKADDAKCDAEIKKTNASSNANEAKSKQNNAPTEYTVEQRRTCVEAQGANADGQTQAIQQSQMTVEEASSNANQSAASTITELDSHNAEIQALISSSENAAAEIEALQNQNNDGTGVGTSSAYSLTTGAEIEEQKANGKAQAQEGEDVGAKVDAKLSVIDSNAGKIDSLTSQAASAQETAQNEITQAAQNAEAEKATADQAQNEAGQSKSDLNQVLDFTKQVATVGDALDAAGTVLNAVGVGLQAAGVTTTATGGAVTATGGVLTGLGAGLTALGIPLCAFFGAGAPVVAGGSTTTAGGATTAATGGTVTTAGVSLNSAGTAINATAKGLQATGKGLKIATTATNGVVHGMQGKWDKVIQDAAGFTVNVAGTTSALGGLGKNLNGKFTTITEFAKTHKNLLANTQNIANAVKDSVKTYQDIRDGKDISQIAIDGLSAVSRGTSAAGFDNISDITNSVSYGIAAAKDASNGEFVDAGFNALSALAAGDAVHTRQMANRAENGSDLSKYLNGATDAESNFYKFNGKVQNVYDNWFKPEDSEPTSAPLIVENYNKNTTGQDDLLITQNTNHNTDLETAEGQHRKKQGIQA